MSALATVLFDIVQGPHYYRLPLADATGELVPLGTAMVGLTRYGMAVGRLASLGERSEGPMPPDDTHPASQADLATSAENTHLSSRALGQLRDLVVQHDLPMRLVEGYLSLDRGQLTFFFTAPGRIDFRMMLRDAVRIFQMPIRLEQVGDRDVARLLGGVGRCGREVCCSAWMPEFAPVSMKHAKEQDLPPVPSQLGGLCGKLRCCLRFELDAEEGESERRPGRRRLPVKTAAFHWSEDESGPLDPD
ncbi:MAG: hypothetical protein HZB16_08335 [Armatimonadetes bacterium]|nr:hypothetical protein [Armatimonadota bacterium]